MNKIFEVQKIDRYKINLTILLTCLLVYVIYDAFHQYYVLKNSEAYQIASDFVIRNNIIIAEFGDLVKLELSGFNIRYSAGSSYDYKGNQTYYSENWVFTMHVNGKDKSGKVRINMHYNIRWDIRKAIMTIDDSTVPINLL